MSDIREPKYEQATPLPDEPYYQVPTTTAPRRGGRTLAGGILLALGVVWLLGVLLGGEGREGPVGGGNILFEQTYEATRLEMDVSTGNIEIRPWDESNIKIEAIYQGGDASDYAVKVDPRDGTVYVTGGPKPGFLSLGQRDIEYRISLPATADVQIKTANGEIDVAELRGLVDLTSTNGDITASAIARGLQAETVNGRIELDEIGGALDLHSTNGEISLSDGRVSSGTVQSVNGDIDLRGVSGKLNVESTNGDIQIGDATDAALRASTSNGDIEFEGSLAPNDISTISTISGDVVVRLPEDSSFTLDATTISGEIDSDFELQDGQESRRERSGTVGNGGPRLEIETTSGDISVIH